MQQFFPVLKKALYFNTAYVGLLSKPLLDFRHTMEKEFFTKGDQFKKDGISRLEKDTTTVAQFLNAPKEQTFLVHNFSIGIRYFTECMPTSTKVLTLTEDYPSLLTAFEERGFTIHSLPINANVEVRVQQVLHEGDFDVLAISMVQYTTGIKFRFSVLEEIKKAHPNLVIVVDGTQWVGTEVVDFANSPIDVLVGSGYKWLLAGFSSGFACCSAFFLQRFNCSAAELQNRIFIGHFDYLGTASLAFAVEQLLNWDFNALMAQKKQLETKLHNGLQESGRLLPLISAREHHSGIFNISGTESDYQALHKRGIHTSLRGSGIRLSVHFYNTSEQIDLLLAAL